MRLFPDLFERVHALLVRSREERELDEELRFHVERQTEANVARGMDPKEARREAHLKLGGVEQTKEAVRRARGTGWIEDLAADLRYGLRRLVQAPGFSVPVILTLALGIGAATAMFSAVDATLLRPLPFEDDARLVMVDEVRLDRSARNVAGDQVWPEVSDLDSLDNVFSHAAAYAPGSLNLASGGEPRRVSVAMVTPSFFPTFGIAPRLGRPFTEAEATPETARVAILSDAIWRGQFGAAPEMVGSTIDLNGDEHRVVGVMPPGFAFPGETEIWLSLPTPIPFSYWEPFRMYVPSAVVARLAPGATVERAGARVLALLRAYRPPDRQPDATAAELVRPLRDHLVRQRRTALLVLMGATALMLLIACANAANLLLARAATRRREIAMRAVLGASGGRIVRQLLVESALLALAGGALGIAIAYATTGALDALIPSSIVGSAPPTVDARVLVFAVVAALASGIAFGIAPALRARRTDPGAAIRSGRGRGATAREATRLRRAFVVSEVALALVLLIGAGVMLRSFQAVLASDPGLNAERVATLELKLARARYGTAVERRAFRTAVLERLRAAPGIEAAAWVNELPLRGEGSVMVTVSPLDATDGGQARGDREFAQFLTVTPDYFRALGIPLLRGRPFVARPDSAGPSEIVISRELADRLWPGGDPIGRRVESNGERIVVGVVGDVRPQALDDAEIIPQMYLPIAEVGGGDLALVARGTLPAEGITARLRDAVRSVDPSQAVYNVRAMEEVIARAIAPRRTTTLLVSIFGALALFLAAVGIYGVISFGVVRRRAELGIRVALGARPANVVALVVREGAVLAVAGAAVGAAGAWALARVLESLVFGVSPRDPIVFALAPMILVGVALLATFVPARRATRVNPLESIRAE